MELPVWWVSASSTRGNSEYGDANGKYSYPPENLLDGKPSTCWTPALVRDAVGNGIGDYVDFYFEYAAAVNGISIMNGYGKSKDIYFANSRPSQIEISFLYVGKDYFTDAVYADLPDKYSTNYQAYSIPVREDVEAVRVKIMSVYGGTKYKGDVCISEVRVYGDWM